MSTKSNYHDTIIEKYKKTQLTNLPILFFFRGKGSHEITFIIDFAQGARFSFIHVFRIGYFFLKTFLILTEVAWDNSFRDRYIFLLYISSFYEIFSNTVENRSRTCNSWYIIHGWTIRITYPNSDNNIISISNCPVVTKVSTGSSFYGHWNWSIKNAWFSKGHTSIARVWKHIKEEKIFFVI